MGSSESKKPVWAVICGAVRNLYEFYPALSHYVKLREEGIIQELVLSTWHDEIDRHKGLRNKLLNLGIGIAESKDAKVSGTNNLWRQFRALDQGLRLCPTDCNVLKGRTDKIAGYIEKFRQPIINISNYQIEFNKSDPFSVFDSPLIVPFYSLTYPFLVKDVAFLGSRKTFDSLCHFENWTEIAQSHSIWPEARWKSYPFLQKFPIFKEIFEQYNPQIISTALVRDSNQKELPDALARLFALYYKLMLTNFRTCFLPEAKWDGATLEELMSNQPTEGVGLAPHEWEYTFVMKDEVLKSAISADSPLSLKIKKYLSNEHDLLNWRHLTPNDNFEIDSYLSNCSIKAFYIPKPLNKYSPPTKASSTLGKWSEYFEYSSLIEEPFSNEEVQLIEGVFAKSLDFTVAIKEIIELHLKNKNLNALKAWINIGATFPEINSWKPLIQVYGEAVSLLMGGDHTIFKNQFAVEKCEELYSLEFARLVLNACLNSPGCDNERIIHFLLEPNPRTQKLRSWLLLCALEQILSNKINYSNEREVIEEIIQNPPYLSALCVCASWLLKNNETSRAITLLEKVEVESTDQEVKQKVSATKAVILKSLETGQPIN